MNFIFLCLLAYFMGSIPTGYVLTKYFAHIDIRQIGSSSTGTTNVLRSGHKKIAIFTLIFDILKGSIIAIISSKYFCGYTTVIPCFICVLGHVYPIWLKFKGGKGVATIAGIFIVLFPIITIISAIFWGIIAKFSKISSIASLSFSIISTILINLDYFMGYSIEHKSYPIFSIVLLVFLLYTHKSNIKRLFQNQENSF